MNFQPLKHGGLHCSTHGPVMCFSRTVDQVFGVSKIEMRLPLKLSFAETTPRSAEIIGANPGIWAKGTKELVPNISKTRSVRESVRT